MAFEFCCFISYPHGYEDVLVPCVNRFAEGLKKEIFAQVRGTDIFVDEHISGGVRMDELGTSLCKSACMIFFYTPLYFDPEHLYCAREYKAMEDLETQRMRHLPDKNKGLIIPIILRGKEQFPERLKAKTKYYNFTALNLSNRPDLIKVKFATQIKEIAQYVIDRYKELKDIDELTQGCASFKLPSEDVTRDFIINERLVDSNVPFPGRTEDSEGGHNG